MKGIKVFLTLLCTITVFFPAEGCDLCGCSAGSSYLGILPNFHKHFMGVQYQYRSFRTKHEIAGTGDFEESKEVFQTYEMRFRYNLGSRIQIFAFVPYGINSQQESGLNTKISGFSDASLLFNYTLIQNGDSICTKWKHSLQAGVGLKLPTGSYSKLDEVGVWNPNIQLGSGSTDFILDLIYNLRYNGFGWSTSAFFNLNGINKFEYQFGNRLNIASQFFYWKDFHRISVLPNAGIQYQYAAQDAHNHFGVDQSGGNQLFASLGTDIYFRNISLGFNVQLPLHNPNDIISSRPKINTTIIWLF